MNIGRILLALFFIISGANHFFSPNFYLAIMPRYFPWHAELVAISGAAEIIGGLGILLPRTRKLAACSLIVLLIAVFPANIHSVDTGAVISGHVVPDWMLWLRLPLQLVFVFCVYRTCLYRTNAMIR